MMYRQLTIFLFILAVPSFVFGQENILSSDTAVTDIKLVVPPLPFERPDLSLPPSLSLLVSNYSPEYLRASLTAPPSLTEKTNRELQDIWQHELALQNEGKTWKTILSLLQAGGTAYILYEHIRKYGLK